MRKVGEKTLRKKAATHFIGAADYVMLRENHAIINALQNLSKPSLSHRHINSKIKAQLQDIAHGFLLHC